MGPFLDLHKNKCIRQSLDECLLPISDLQQREQEYVKKREKYIDFLKFEALEIQNTPTDFIVNGKKVQEKVGFVDKKDRCTFTMHKNNGAVKGVRKFKCYEVGVNDLYWLNCDEKETFYERTSFSS